MADIDVQTPSIARVYDYLLGGKDNISQVVEQDTHNDRMPAVCALHGDYSNVWSSGVR